LFPARSYEAEALTKSLWVAEGVTSYYDRLLVKRAGLCTEAEYLAGEITIDEEQTRGFIERLQETPGRFVQTLEESSFDAWIKDYRRDENSLNTSISYYVKGAVVAFLLDARIRKATNDGKCLDDVMRLACLRYSGSKGFTSEEFQGVAQDVAGTDLTEWFTRALQTTEELSYTEALDWFGLRFASVDDNKSAEPEKAWLGLDTKVEEGRLMVVQVKRGTPGYEAGFDVDDEIVGLEEYRVLPGQWSKRLEQYRPGEKISVLIARRERMRCLEVTCGAKPPRRWKLEVNPEATEEQTASRKKWLNSSTQRRK